MQFRWIAWNVEHLAQHGVTPDEAEWVVQRNRARRIGEGRYRARGQTAAGRFIQVVFVLDPDDTVFAIHGRPLTAREKQSLRKERR